LTAYANLESAIKGTHHGVDDIRKRVTTDALLAVLAEKLAAHPQKRELRKYPVVN
jgi:hypothetical protein